MRFIIFTFFIVTTVSLSAQEQIKIHWEKIENGYIVYGDNDQNYPMSVKVHFDVENLSIAGQNDATYILKASTKKQELSKLKRIKPNKGYKFSYTTLYNYGDDSLTSYDSYFEYTLPYKTGEVFKLHQGYNGKKSHKNKNALDFTMPVGTSIYAARGGIVTKVVETNTKNCFKRDCIKYNNLIRIYHPDGTFAEYAHLKHNGAAVNEGETIKKGQLIGYSGNTGYSDGPHLHFVVFLQHLKERETLETRFKIKQQKESELLEEGKLYLREF